MPIPGDRLALAALATPFAVPGIGLLASTVVGSGTAGERLARLLAGTVFAIVAVAILSRAFPAVVQQVRSAEQPVGRSLARKLPAIAIRLVIGIMCFTPMLIATGVIPSDGEPPAPRWIGLLAALVFAVGGLYVLLFEPIRNLRPAVRGRVEGAVVLLIVTCFAVIADWIAFGTGGSAFTSSFSAGPVGVSWLADELVGRVVFGLSGTFLSAVTFGGWWQFVRGRPGSPPGQ